MAQLELPRIESGVRPRGFDLRPDAAFPGNSASEGPRKPFTQDPEKGVLVFELHLDPGEDRLPDLVRRPDAPRHHAARKYELFVLRETLVTLAREGEERLALVTRQASWRAEAERYIEWTDWGEKGSRMLILSMPQRIWVRFFKSHTLRADPIHQGLFVLRISVHLA